VETTGVEPPGARSAFAEPERPVSSRWVGLWAAASFAIYMPMFAALIVQLPLQAESVSGKDGAEVTVAWVTGVGALVSIVASVMIGALSDRTIHGRGRRQAWLLGGAVAAAAAIALLGTQKTVIGMVLVWMVFQVGASSMSTALSAVVPDEVPVHQRGFVSAWYGVSLSLGPLLGIIVVGLILVDDLAAGYAALGVAVILLAFPFALLVRGTPLKEQQRQPFRLAELWSGVAEPFAHRDFAWAFTGRFFLQLSNSIAQIYLLLYLDKQVGYDDPETGVLILTLIYTIAVVGATIPAGRISDRTGKRKRMVFVSSALQGGAGLILAFIPTFPAAMVGALVLGIGFGVYAAVDQALISQVLPSAEGRGKDLGVINLANTGPYVLAPVIAAPVVTSLGGYPVLYVLVLVTGLIAAATVRPIKSVS
jgi:MFS family permease